MLGGHIKNLLTLIPVATFLVSCDSQVIETDLILQDNILMVRHSMEPYTGPVFGYYETGEKMFEYICTAGNLPNEFTFYTLEGRLKEAVKPSKIREKNGKLCLLTRETPYWGNVQGQYGNGNPRIRAVILDGRYFGPYQEFFPEGNLKLDRFYAEEGLEGEERIYSFRNGEIIERSNYRHGRLDGPHVKYDENGLILLEETFIRDTLDGKRVAYWDNGQVRERGRFSLGMYQGEHETFYRDGVRESQALFDSTGRQLWCKLFNDQGGLVLSEEWEYEGMVSRKESVYYQGDKITCRQIQKAGWTYEYDARGRLETQFQSEDGYTINGQYYKYHPNGKLAVKGRMQAGEKVGRWLEYHQDGNVKSSLTF